MYDLAFRGIQSVFEKLLKRQRDEIFKRVLEVLTLENLPLSTSFLVNHINLLTRFIEKISHPFILLKRENTEEKNENYIKLNRGGESPLITLANRLDSDSCMELGIAPALALKVLAEVTLKYVISPKLTDKHN